ncbi:MAG: magnesium transporter [Bacillota bacterium]|nr:magnesium transporter [Bacillota bacterium]MDD3297429.1 magnesium transporter [Bacillota bacterium]MDD3850241.1 magnesium transporter [Bacillota bacterium]MDD4707198.1 magnesium transporter [Bacillota bacterium]
MQDLRELYRQKRFKELVEQLNDWHEADLAEYFKELNKDERIILFRLLKKDLASGVFSQMEKEEQVDLINAITDHGIRDLLSGLAFDDKVDLLEEMPANVAKKVLQNVSKEERKIINQFLKFPENSAGSIMTIEYVDLKEYYTVSYALQHIRKTGVTKETIYTCYVIDSKRHLKGTISLKDIIMAEETAVVGDLMEEKSISVQTTDDQEEVAALFKKYDLLSVPVLDHENRLIGIITIDDIIDVIEEEGTEDFYRMAAMEATEDDYFSTGVFSLAKKRIIWLMVLMVSATLTGNIIGHFQTILHSAISLTVFIPMLMDTGGNAGAQSSTLIIRGMAIGKIKRRDTLKILSKELKVSLVVGITLGIVNFIRIILFEGESVSVALTVSITVFLTIVLAKLTGSVLPIIARSAGLDPALISAPLITTIIDALALILYFNLALIILGPTMFAG